MGMESPRMACAPTSGHGEATRTDAQLLADGTAGLRVLYERHFDALFRYAAARVGRQAAEDVVAETFAIAFTRRAAFDASRASALPWLIGIATNLLRSQRRAERKHLATDPGRIDPSGAPDPGLETTISRADAAAVRGAVMRAVRRLARSEREAFLVHALAGLDGAELGVALGVSSSAAAVRLHRARAKLRVTLASQEDVL
jgi:RNA polymerase sigma factor (sigma-70 family)